MKNNTLHTIHRKRNKNLGVPELVAIALGGMIGGGIFTVLGISVAMIGVFTPLAFLIGGVLAYLAAYSYIKLGVYYQDEGATYSFVKKHHQRVSRIAFCMNYVAGDLAEHLGSHFISAKVKHFGSNERDKAKKWIISP